MNTAHLHLILNHVPVLGTAFGLAVLVWGLWQRSDDIKRLALTLLTVTALSAIPAYLTGEPAEGAVKGMADVAGNLIERHEEAAGVALAGALVMGAFAVVGLVAFRRQRTVPSWFGVTTLLGAVAVSGLMAWAANLGGQVHHPEIRSGMAPVGQAERHHD